MLLCIAMTFGAVRLAGRGSYILIDFVPERDCYEAKIVTVRAEETVRSFRYDEARYYLFLPAYARGIEVRYGEGKPLDDGTELILMYSENLPALFVQTEEEAAEFLTNKEVSAPGRMQILLADGSVDYEGEIAGIRGRGNTTWGTDKKAYNIHLEEAHSLLGMGKGKKWTLLSLHKEGTHLNTKLALDMAKALDLPYTSDSEWADVYFNGEYYGNYLVTEPVDIGKYRIPIYDLEEDNRKNNDNLDTAANYAKEMEKGYLLDHGDFTDGGYIVERDTHFYYEAEKCGFRTSDGGTFTIKSPDHASREQVRYIKGYFDRAADAIAAGTPDYELLDLPSLAKRGLVEEISLNQDAFYGSMYFYKRQGEEVLYSGPVWDYDRAFGENNSRGTDGRNINPAATVFEYGYWYKDLVRDPLFMEEMTKDYTEALPEMIEIADERPDLYAAYIRASMEMDNMRWKRNQKMGNRPGQYATFDNNVRYLKWFTLNRLKNLCERWEIPYEGPGFTGDGSTHTVTVKKDDQVFFEVTVPDGETGEGIDLPVLEEEIYEGWNVEFCDEPFWDFLPILEDTVIYAKKGPD